MHAIQIVLTCFAVFAFSRVLIRYRRGGMRMLHLGLWLIFWTAVVVVSLHPNTTDRLAILDPGLQILDWKCPVLNPPSAIRNPKWSNACNLIQVTPIPALP